MSKKPSKKPSKRKIPKKKNMKTSKKTRKKTNSLKIITSTLNNAIVNGNLKKVKELLKKGANPNEFTNVWCSPKMHNRRYAWIDCKLDDIGCKCGSLGTSLHLALFLRNKKVIYALLDHGVDVNLTHDSFKLSPLQLGVYCGIDIIKELYKKGCKDVNYIDFEGESVLMQAVWNEHASTKDDRLDIIKFLVSKGANVNFKENVLGSTPLEMACKIGHINVIKYLISKGANVNNVNKRKRTPLHEAIVQDKKNSNCNKLQIVKLLIDKGSKVNTQSKETKSSPLLSATAYGLTSIVKLLLSKGATKNIKDNNKMTPLEIAEWKGFHSIVTLLK